MQAAREHAVSLESAATSEMAAADEAFVQLGDAETTVSAWPFFCLVTFCRFHRLHTTV